MPHGGADGADQKALGLVDELDDPGPGHLSERPQPLTATTNVNSGPVFKSLQDRFVKGSGSEKEAGLRAEGEEDGQESTTEQ